MHEVNVRPGSGNRPSILRARAIIGFCLAVLLGGAGTRADETDQYTLPLDRRLADVGDYLDLVHCRALERAVRELNERVRFARTLPDQDERRAAMARAHDPELAVAAVAAVFDLVLSERYVVGESLSGEALEHAYPGRLVTYAHEPWLYAGAHYWIDPRGFDQLIRASTVRAYGVHFGVDKLLHFHQMGAKYYHEYRSRLKEGLTQAQALRATARLYAEGSLLGETGFLGLLSSSVYSNADLAANYAGLKFCINITEPVVLKGRSRPPLLVRSGDFWRVNTHVRPESGWFGAFVSDHWNEALNPCLLGSDIRTTVRTTLRRRAAQVREFYTRVDHRPDRPDYYEDLARDLSTFEGEDYGHSANWNDLITVGQVGWSAD